MALRKCIIVFGLLITVMSNAQEQLIDKIAAVVGDNAILISTIESEMVNMPGSGDKEKCNLLESLMIQDLLVDQAKLDTIEVAPSQVDGELDRRLNGFLARLGGDKSKLEKMYKKSYIDIRADFKEIVEKQLIAEKVRGEITKDLKIVPSDVTEYFNKIPKDSLPEIEEQYEIQEIKIKPEYTEEEIQKVKDKLNGFKKRIADGTSLSTLAILYSEGPSAVKGGELGFMDRKNLDKNFSAAAFKLKKGEISDIVKSEFGYHIIELVERRGEQINVKHILLQPKVTIPQLEKAEKKLDSIANVLREGKMTFHEAAFYHSTDEDTKNNAGLMVNPMTGASLFPISVCKELGFYQNISDLKLNEISSPFLRSDQRKGRSISIMKIKKVIPKHKMNMTDDYQLLLNNATNYKNQTEVNKWIKRKIKSTYLKIDQDFHGCKFNFDGWVKK